MVLRRHQDITPLETPGGHTTFTLLPAIDNPHAIGMIRQQQLPGGKNPFHSHNCEEVMLQCAGTVTVSLGEQQLTLHPGDLLIIPPETQHQIENTGTETAEWLLIWPAGARFFTEDGSEIQPAWARLAAAQAEQCALNPEPVG